MFDTQFDHYLTYGATDQRTLRELQDSFTGLIVPGTVAAFQREGNGRIRIKHSLLRRRRLPT